MRPCGLMNQPATARVLTASKPFRHVMTKLRPRYRTSGTCALAMARILLAWVALLAAAFAQRSSPLEFVRAAIQNQINADAHPPSSRGLNATIHGHNSQVEHLVNTPQGVVSRVVLIDDKPLNPDQRSPRTSAFGRCSIPHRCVANTRSSRKMTSAPAKCSRSFPKHSTSLTSAV